MPISSSSSLSSGSSSIENGATVQNIAELNASLAHTVGNPAVYAGGAVFAAEEKVVSYEIFSGGIHSGTNVGAGTNWDLTSGALETGGTVGGLVIAGSGANAGLGGTIMGVTFSGKPDGNALGANGYVNYGGTANNNTVISGAVLSKNCDYGFANNVAMSGGTIAFGNSGTFSIVSLGADGEPVIASKVPLGWAIVGNNTALDGGLIHVSNWGMGLGVLTIGSGGTLLVDSGARVSSAIIAAGQDKWAGGASVSEPNEAGGSVASGAFLNGAVLANGAGTGSTVDTMGGLLRVQPGATITNLQIGDYGQVEVEGVKYNAGESVVYNNTITLLSDGQPVIVNGKPWSITLGPSPDGRAYVGTDFKVWQDSNGNAVMVYDRCFLRGTKIATPKGEIPIEQLKAGDEIFTFKNGKESVSSVTYLHYQKGKISPELPKDLAGYPVCIKANAFGEALPKRDLWVTPEHCFLFEGRLVPVRMLVNGHSVYYDISFQEFDYFHLETEPHAIIKAEGVLTESWLNTNTRREAVKINESVTRLDVIPSRTWEKDAAAPLEVSQHFVQPLWQSLEKRAESLKIEKPYEENGISLSEDPELRLKLSNGQEIPPEGRQGNRYEFKLSAKDAGALKLVSKLFRPSESIGPWIDDRRQLGVLVGKMTVFAGGKAYEMRDHLTENLSGWDVVESCPCRWTKGIADLPAFNIEATQDAPIKLSVEILAGGPYVEYEKDQARLFKN